MYRVGRRKLASRKDLNKDFSIVTSRINPPELRYSKAISSRGFTIMETMIFLVVTAGLFASAMLLINGQEAKTEFYQAVRDVNTQILDVINDVATGYYNNPTGFTCIYGAAGPVATVAAADTQGTNDQCIFIGRVISFGIHGDDTTFSIFNVIGNRQNGSAVDAPLVTDLAQARPTPLSRWSGGPPGFPDTHHTSLLPGGLTVGSMKYTDGGATFTPLGSVGIFSTFSTYTSGVLNSGSQTANLIPVLGSEWANQTNTQDIARNIYINAATSPKDPSGGVEVCFNSGGTNQHATITIGGQGKLTSTAQIWNGPCP